MRRRAALAVLAAVAVALLAPPAAADDETSIDGRLQDAGHRDAYTSYVNADGGVRVVVDYTTGSADRAAYEREAEDVARLVWENLELRVLAVDVTPSNVVGWLDGGLPPTVSFSRADLQGRFGGRAPELDRDDSSWMGSEETGLLVAGIGAVVLLGVGAGAGFLAGWLVGRRRRHETAWSSVPAAGWGPAPPPPGAGPYAATGGDPWRPA